MSGRHRKKKHSGKETKGKTDEQRTGISSNNLWTRIYYNPPSQYGYSTFQRFQTIGQSDTRIVDRYISESVYGTFESNKTIGKKPTGKAHLVFKKIQ